MYVLYNPNPNGILVGDCVIRAISNILDTSWETVYVALCVQGYINVETELNDILPQYRIYQDIKRKYQLQEVTENAVINAVYNLCREIKEFINTLYSNTDMPAERNAIADMIKQFNF